MAGFGNGRGSMPLLRGSTLRPATKNFKCRKADLPKEEKSEARRAVSSPQHKQQNKTARTSQRCVPVAGFYVKYSVEPAIASRTG